MLIEMDVTQQLKEKVKVHDPSGKGFEQLVVYEWRPMYCAKCCQLGHVCKEENPPGGKPNYKKVWRMGRVLDPDTNPLIDNRGIYKSHLVEEDKNGNKTGQEEQHWSIVEGKSSSRMAHIAQ